MWYQFGHFVEFPYHSKGMTEHRRWVKHFEERYGPSSECKLLEGRTFSTWIYNSDWREEHNAKAKRLRVYIKNEKDLTWAQLSLA
jgi:hypothetical protein